MRPLPLQCGHGSGRSGRLVSCCFLRSLSILISVTGLCPAAFSALPLSRMSPLTTSRRSAQSSSADAARKLSNSYLIMSAPRPYSPDFLDLHWMAMNLPSLARLATTSIRNDVRRGWIVPRPIGPFRPEPGAADVPFGGQRGAVGRHLFQPFAVGLMRACYFRSRPRRSKCDRVGGKAA